MAPFYTTEGKGKNYGIRENSKTDNKQEQNEKLV